MLLNDFIKEEDEGVIFCKIGKSSEKIWGKGGYFPYRDYIGKIINLSEGAITFERLDDVVKYLHYGDDLVIFSFTEGKDELPIEGYQDNILNKKCYDTKSIYVKDVLSFCDAGTVDFIYERMKDKTNFEECSNLAIFHLRDRDLVDAAQRWSELVDRKNTPVNENVQKEQKANVFWNCIIRYFAKKHD